MKSTAANGGLRRLLFAGGLAATGAAALLSPDWSAALKAQGYYGNVDLGIDVAAPPQLQPGDVGLFVVTVRNQGPDTAHRVRTIAAAPQLSHVGGEGCNGPRYPQCALADSLDAGTSTQYVLQLQVPNDARNHVQFSASVMADDAEIQPGDEIVVMKIPVYVLLDLRSDIACARNGAQDHLAVRCSIRFSNVGSHAARQPRLQAGIAAMLAAPPNWSCEASQPSLCANLVAQGAGYSAVPTTMPAGSTVTFFVDMLLRSGAPVIALDAQAQPSPAMGETDLEPGNNHSTLEFEPSLFAHDFEPAG
ncbi:MAG TPA: hypothetical protein VM847_03225 [Tahibacter sp.]|nr:hypothetical protein [Tahibacter sp.]